MRSSLLVNARAAVETAPLAGAIGTTRAGGGGASILAELGNRHLLFCEARQAVYELDDLAAHVWRSLDTGMSAAQIMREIIDAGADHDQAERAVEVAIEALGALRDQSKASTHSSASGSTDRLTRLTIRMADVAVQLHLSKALVADVRAVFGLLITDLKEGDALLCAQAVGRTVSFFSPGQPEWSCDRSHFIPVLKAQLIESMLQCARYEVALHAAALVRGNEAVLLVGRPGAGKTTLAIALARAGLEVMADDVVLLDGEGLVSGVSLPFAAKASSWPLISRHWPGIADRPSHRRPDGQELCYIPHDPVADPRPRRIRDVVLLNRRDHVRTRVDELDPVGALSALVAEGATRDQRLSSLGFTSLVEGLREARCCRLTYSDLLEATDAVCSRPS